MLRRFFILIILFFLILTNANAEDFNIISFDILPAPIDSASSIIIGSGTVHTLEGNIYKNDILMILKDLNSDKQWAVLTDTSGIFVIPNLETGTYQISEIALGEYRWYAGGVHLTDTLSNFTINDTIIPFQTNPHTISEGELISIGSYDALLLDDKYPYLAGEYDMPIKEMVLDSFYNRHLANEPFEIEETIRQYKYFIDYYANRSWDKQIISTLEDYLFNYPNLSGINLTLALYNYNVKDKDGYAYFLSLMEILISQGYKEKYTIEAIELKNSCVYAILLSIGNDLDRAALYFIQGLDERETKPKKAINYYKRALKYSSDNAIIYLYLGRAYGDLELYNEALEAYEKALDLAPFLAITHYELGTVYSDIGDKSNAVELWKKTQELAPQSWAAQLADLELTVYNVKYGQADAINYFKYGTMCFSIEQFDSAAYYLQKAIGLKEDYIEAYVSLANVYDKQEEWELAIDMCIKIIEYDSTSAMAYNNIAWFYCLQNKNLDEALNYIQKALELENKEAEYWDTLAEVYYLQKKYDLALEAINKARKLDPNSIYFKEQLEKIEKARENSQ